MNRRMLALIAGTLLAAAASAAPAEDAGVSAERRLQDAQRRLEEAAREVAELSAEAAGPQVMRAFDYLLPAPRRAMLGVNLGGAEPGAGGVRVESVSPGGPAAEAGVKAGDLIVGFGGKPVATGRELVRALEAIEPGSKVELSLRRDGKPLELSVEPRPLDPQIAFTMAPMAAMHPLPPMPGVAAADFDAHWLLGGWGDAELVTLTPGLGRYFGTEKGVLVARAPRDDSLGLEDGDVIVSIGGREPQSGPHAMRILRSYQPGEPVELRILRDRRARTLTATVPARAPRDVLHFVPPPKAPAPPAPPAPPRASARD